MRRDCPEHHIMMSLNFLPKETENGSREGVMVCCDVSARMDKGWGLQFRGVGQGTHPWMQQEFILGDEISFSVRLVCFMVYSGFL